MIYFDNAATTWTDRAVLDTFVQVTRQFGANPNALHARGHQAKKLMEEATLQVATLFDVKASEVIFTSCASESNNFAVQGLLKSYPHRKKRILTTPLEHSSLSVLWKHLAKEGVEICFLKLQEDGKIDLKDLKEQLKKDTLLVSIHHVNSEVGIIQDIDEIGTILQDYPKTFFHVDGTQSVGKIPISLEKIDLFSCSAHKFFGLKGSGCLIKKESVHLTPLIFGGKSQSPFRAGTPSVASIASFAKALRLALFDLEKKYQHAKALEQRLLDGLSQMEGVVLNHDEGNSPYIINFSVLFTKPETLLHALSQREVYLSTKTACSESGASDALLALGKSEKIASHSLRISFSYQNTIEEVEQFLKILKETLDALNLKKGAN